MRGDGDRLVVAEARGGSVLGAAVPRRLGRVAVGDPGNVKWSAARRGREVVGGSVTGRRKPVAERRRRQSSTLAMESKPRSLKVRSGSMESAVAWPRTTCGLGADELPQAVQPFHGREFGELSAPGGHPFFRPGSPAPVKGRVADPAPARAGWAPTRRPPSGDRAGTGGRQGGGGCGPAGEQLSPGHVDAPGVQFGKAGEHGAATGLVAAQGADDDGWPLGAGQGQLDPAEQHRVRAALDETPWPAVASASTDCRNSTGRRRFAYQYSAVSSAVSRARR